MTPTEGPGDAHARALLDDLDAVVWEADVRTAVFAYVSEAAARVVGWPAREWLDRPAFFSEQLHPEDREAVLARFLGAGSGTPLDVEHRFIAGDGGVRWLRTMGHVADGPDGSGTLLRGICLDVTDAHAAAADRREAELRFQRVVERLPAIVYLGAAEGPDDQPGRMLYVSPQVLHLLGFTPEEWVSDPTAWARQVHPEDRERVRGIHDHAATGEGTFVADYRMLTRDGRVRWFHDEAVLIRDDEGAPLFWQGIMQDVTARHEGQDRAHDAQERYRLLVEQLPAIVYSEDITGDGLQVVYINSQVRDLLGMEPEEWVANPAVWYEAIHPDDVEAVMAENARTEITGDPFSTEYRMIARDGRIVWFKDEARLVRRADGQPAYWHGVMMDITDRKQAESLVAETEARYRALVEQMPTITYIAALGRGAGVLYISPQTGSILGYSPQNWYADPGLWLRIVHPDDRGRNHPDPAAGEHDQRYRIIARDGHEIWVHDRATLILDEHGEPKYWQGVLVDVTEQRRAEALERDLASERLTSEQLREADALKSTFLQAVSHDLRSPLAAILGLARTLERDDLNLPPEDARDLASRIADNAGRLDRMVADLLDLERLAAGVAEPIFAPVDVGTLVRELVAGADVIAGRRVQMDTAPLMISADATMIERIVENLLGNAAKHTPGDSRIWARVERADGGALIVVEDDGPGVSADDRQRIFQAFRQGDSPDRSSGVGVGLAVVARFAELHGGRAWVQDRKGGGASFRVLLAADPRSDQPAETDPSSEASQA